MLLGVLSLAHQSPLLRFQKLIDLFHQLHQLVGVLLSSRLLANFFPPFSDRAFHRANK